MAVKIDNNKTNSNLTRRNKQPEREAPVTQEREWTRQKKIYSRNCRKIKSNSKKKTHMDGDCSYAGKTTHKRNNRAKPWTKNTNSLTDKTKWTKGDLSQVFKEANIDTKQRHKTIRHQLFKNNIRTFNGKLTIPTVMDYKIMSLTKTAARH